MANSEVIDGGLDAELTDASDRCRGFSVSFDCHRFGELDLETACP